MDEALTGLFREHLAAVRARVEQVLAGTDFDGLLIPSGLPPLQFGDDLHYPFKANPQFKLWVPEAEPGCYVLYLPGMDRPRLCFHQPADYWHKPPPVPTGGWTSEFDVAVMAAPEDVGRLLPGRARLAILGEPHPAWSGLGDANPPPLLTRLDYHRATKTPYEIECLAQANRRAAAAHRAAEAAYREGAAEYDIHLAYCRAAAVREEELPYNSIVAIGANAAVLHYQRLERARPADGRSFLIDAGAPWAGYGSDITRTYASGPGPFTDLLEGLDAAQQRLTAQVRPGVDYREIHLAAHREIASLLCDSGLVRIPAQDACASGATSVFFPHGIGHLLGLQVHDVGGLMADESGAERPRPAGHPYLRLTRDLAPGCVVTIEPGIYFIESLLAEAANGKLRSAIDWRRVDGLRPYGGIRIEDNVVALDGGPRNLTREAFAAEG